MQYSGWYDDSMFAVCFWRELPEQNIVKLPRGINVLAPGSCRIEIFLRQIFNLAPPFGQYHRACALLRNPDTIRARLAQDVLQNDFFRTQARLDCLQRSRLVKPFGLGFRSFG